MSTLFQTFTRIPDAASGDKVIVAAGTTATAGHTGHVGQTTGVGQVGHLGHPKIRKNVLPAASLLKSSVNGAGKKNMLLCV